MKKSIFILGAILASVAFQGTSDLARLEAQAKTITIISTPVEPTDMRGWLEHIDEHGMRSWARATMPPRMGNRMPQEAVTSRKWPWSLRKKAPVLYPVRQISGKPSLSTSPTPTPIQ